jgi:hypothetical protein
MHRKVPQGFLLVSALLLAPNIYAASDFNDAILGLQEVQLQRLQDSGLIGKAEIGQEPLSFKRHPNGSLQSLRAGDVGLPVDRADTPEEAAYRFMELNPGLFGIAAPRSGFLLEDSRWSRSQAHVLMRQVVGKMPVFGSRLTIHVGIDHSIVGVTGTYLPDTLLPKVGPAMAGEAIGENIGLFHGSLFGIRTWDAQPAVIATRVYDADAKEGPVVRYVSLNGDVLLTVRAEQNDAPADSYYSPNGSSFPGNPIRLDSNQRL